MNADSFLHISISPEWRKLIRARDRFLRKIDSPRVPKLSGGSKPLWLVGEMVLCDLLGGVMSHPEEAAHAFELTEVVGDQDMPETLEPVTIKFDVKTTRTTKERLFSDPVRSEKIEGPEDWLDFLRGKRDVIVFTRCTLDMRDLWVVGWSVDHELFSKSLWAPRGSLDPVTGTPVQLGDFHVINSSDLREVRDAPWLPETLHGSHF